MLKSMCLGVGLFLLILGLSLHAIDSYTIKSKPVQTSAWATPEPAKVIAPEPWKPWVYLGAGTILMLWTFTLPARMKGK